MTSINLCVNQSNLPAATVVAESEEHKKNDYETTHHRAHGNADNLCLREAVWCSATLAIHVKLSP